MVEDQVTPSYTLESKLITLVKHKEANCVSQMRLSDIVGLFSGYSIKDSVQRQDAIFI